MDDGDSRNGVEEEEEEGAGESSGSGGGGGGGGAHGGLLAVRKQIFNRLLEIGHEEALADPNFERLLDDHYDRLPLRYTVVNLPEAE